MPIVLNNPVTKTIEHVTQAQFNSYMAMTNGEAASWVVTDKTTDPDLLKYNPDQARDERGRWTSGGGGLSDKYGFEAASHARTLYSHAAGIEPVLTANMKDLAAKYGTKLKGLKYRLKTQESLTRKIATDAVNKNIKISEAASQISDANRYTMVSDPATYRSSAEGVVNELKSQGYTVNVKNYWQEGSNYKGINMAITDTAGNNIELQFHTAESLALKETDNHPLYEAYRVLDRETPEAKALNAQMVANSARLETPPNLSGFGTPKIGKTLDNKLQVVYYRDEGGL
jgi:hypothetical protein